MAGNVQSGFDAILKSASKSKNFEKTFAVIHRELGKLVKLDAMAIATLGSEAPLIMRCAGARGKTRSFWVEKEIFHRSPLKKSLQACKSPLKRIPGSDRFAQRILGKDMQTILMLPLVSQSRTVGALAVGRKTRRAFSAADTSVLSSYAGMLSPLVHLQKFTSQYEDFSFMDPITGLRNHHYLQLRLEEEINRVDRYKGWFALLLIDIDNFRAFNDKYGFMSGSQALKTIAEIIQENLRQVDFAARYEADTFAVILTKSTIDDAKLIANRVRKIISRTNFAEAPKKSRLTVSSGIAVYPTDSSFQSGLLEAADMALVRAKARGSNRTYTFANMLARK